MVLLVSTGRAGGVIDAISFISLLDTMPVCRENVDRQLQKKEADCEQMQADVEKITKYDKLRAKAQRLRARVAQLREQHEAVCLCLPSLPWRIIICGLMWRM